MEVDLATSPLAAASLNISEAMRLFGVPVGRKYIQRVGVLLAVEKFAHLYGHRALRLHPLRGDRSG